MKLVIKRVVAAVVFAGILLGVVNAVGFFARPIDVEADNMNYLYKEDKDKFYFIINSWKKENISKECEWVIKHGSRNVKE